MNLIVNGWMEKEIRKGETAHLLHLINTRGAGVCRCPYNKGSSMANNRADCVEVDVVPLLREEGTGRAFLAGQVGGVDEPYVELCDKSSTALQKDMHKLKEFSNG